MHELAKHTPGPWFVFGNGHCVGGPIEGDAPAQQNTAGVAMCGMARRSAAEREANARLISAAPDLLAACEAAVEYAAICCATKIQTTAESRKHAGAVLAQLQAAIAKAKGQS